MVLEIDVVWFIESIFSLFEHKVLMKIINQKFSISNNVKTYRLIQLF